MSGSTAAGQQACYVTEWPSRIRHIWVLLVPNSKQNRSMLCYYWNPVADFNTRNANAYILTYWHIQIVCLEDNFHIKPFKCHILLSAHHNSSLVNMKFSCWTTGIPSFTIQFLQHIPTSNGWKLKTEPVLASKPFVMSQSSESYL